MLAGKVVIITGAARGIGLAAVHALTEGGALVVAAVRSSADLAATQAVLGESGRAVACDVTDYAQVEALVGVALNHYGRVDGLVNNAGVIAPIGPIADADPAAWATNMSANLTGVFHCCRAVLPHMLQRGSGVIINLSSGAASRPLEGWSAYCAAKAGLAMLTRSLVLEVGPSGVLVYGLRPGLVDTGMQAAIRTSGVNEVSKIPQAQLASPTDPAQLIAWLCGSVPPDLAGQELDIRDEGLRARAGLR